MSTTKTHTQRFEGPANKGLRAQIRKAVAAAWLDGPEAVERAVLGIGGTVALTASGLHSLKLTATDYAEDAARWARHQKT